MPWIKRAGREAQAQKPHFLRRLLRDQRGTTLAMMTAGLFPAIAAVGSAVDLGRVFLVRSQMQAGVDAAALAGARSFGVTDAARADSRDQQVKAYFRENFPDDFLGAGQIEPNPTFSTVRGINVTRVEASTDLRMVFMQLFGVEPKKISVVAVAELQPKPLEVMVVLDDTGSMQTKLGSRSRMAALQDAMYDFINILHQGSDRRKELALGMVTYTVTTNVGGILQSAGVPIENRDGFINVGNYTGGLSTFPSNPLGWKGCVENDQTVRDVGNNATVFEDGAWDVDKYLPGETDPKGVSRPHARPYHYPPSTNSPGSFSTSAKVATDYRASHANTDTGDGRRNNLYYLHTPGNMAVGEALANAPAYRQHFYDMYIGLNADPSNPADDVIVKNDGSDGYYAPGSGPGWKVNYSRIPYITGTRDWSFANPRYGYPTASGYTLKMATPNWQCPEPSMDVQYDRPKSDYIDYIRDKNYPLMPASGTLHHIGMLWGYRLLTRDDRFTRVNPVPSERPLRALVFMTDGDTQANGDAMWYGSYGSLREKRITNSTDANTFKTQIMRRFAKVCENAKRDGITVYIVSLLPAPGGTRDYFRGCAGANYLETNSADTIRDAFQQIAVDLVDLHLVQ